MQRCLSKASKNLHDASRLLCVGHMEINIFSNQDDVDLRAIFRVLTISDTTFGPACSILMLCMPGDPKNVLAIVVKAESIFDPNYQIPHEI